MKRRICVLTQPLRTNYGGILQAYALQVILKRMGHDVVTDLHPYKEVPTLLRFLSASKMFLLKLFLIKGAKEKYPYYRFLADYKRISIHTQSFIDKYINVIDFFRGNKVPSLENIEQFDTFIVGSDQVWRPQYSSFFANYFLDFIAKDKTKIKIAYAASFGTSDWELTEAETDQAASLLREFDSISVREDTAVELCHEKLHANSLQVLDPTLLLDKSEYVYLVEKEKIPKTKGNLMVYILDNTTEKQSVVYRISTFLNLVPFQLMPESKPINKGDQLINKCIYPKVTEWLRGFMDAKFVVTDSFHGTVFSILFNKPFIVMANKERGLTRFTSLLKLFGLENRLIYSHEELSEHLMCEEIDFEVINVVLEKERKKALKFLSDSMS